MALIAPYAARRCKVFRYVHSRHGFPLIAIRSNQRQPQRREHKPIHPNAAHGQDGMIVIDDDRMVDTHIVGRHDSSGWKGRSAEPRTARSAMFPSSLCRLYETVFNDFYHQLICGFVPLMCPTLSDSEEFVICLCERQPDQSHNDEQVLDESINRYHRLIDSLQGFWPNHR